MSYNIFNGFHDLKDEEWVFNKKRLQAAQRVVKREKPDILCLNEADYAAPNPKGIFLDYQKLFGYKYISVGTMTDRKANVILSNTPLVETMTIGMPTVPGITASCTFFNTTINLMFIHPFYLARDKELIRDLTPFLKEVPNNFIVLGDYNSLSDEDNIDTLTIKKVIKRVNPTYHHENIPSLLDRTFIPWLRKKGLIDILKKYDDRKTLPTDLIDKEKEGALRLDYFLITKDINVAKAYMIDDEDTNKASDHYPIVLKIKV